jgi:hypothetical protein
MRNPRFCRFLGALFVEGVVYGAIQSIVSRSASASDALEQARLSLDAGGGHAVDLGFDLADWHQRAASFTLPPVEHLQRSPQRAAAELTGRFLGKGALWFRDLLRSVPPRWRPGRRRRFASNDELRHEMFLHPERFDAFTRAERLFYKRLPSSAREVIEKAVRALRFADPAAAEYLLAPFEHRNVVPPPPLLFRAVWAAVDTLPADLRRTVVRAARRPLKSRLVGMRPDGSLRHSFLVTPLPAFGPPRQRPFRARVGR